MNQPYATTNEAQLLCNCCSKAVDVIDLLLFSLRTGKDLGPDALQGAEDFAAAMTRMLAVVRREGHEHPLRPERMH